MTYMLVLLIVGVVIFCRSLSFVVTQGSLRADRESWCIPRLVRQQKAADLLIILYNLAVTFVGLWLGLYGGWGVFSETTVPLWITLICPAVLLAFFIIYHIVFFLTNRKISMIHTFNEVVSYRKKQEVVTKDNDHEVNFIRSVKRILKDRKTSAVWAILLIVMMILL